MKNKDIYWLKIINIVKEENKLIFTSKDILRIIGEEESKNGFVRNLYIMAGCFVSIAQKNEWIKLYGTGLGNFDNKIWTITLKGLWEIRKYKETFND